MAKKLSTKGAIGAAIASVVAGVGGAAHAADNEKCYGVSLAQQNGCAAGPGTTCAATSLINYQGNAWSLVPAGSCESIVIEDAEDGLVRHGSLEPLARDLPRLSSADLPTPVEEYVAVEGFEPFVSEEEEAAARAAAGI